MVYKTLFVGLLFSHCHVRCMDQGEGILETKHIVTPPLSIGLSPSKVIIFLLRKIRRQKLY